jgi:hypothetical protein
VKNKYCLLLAFAFIEVAVPSKLWAYACHREVASSTECQFREGDKLMTLDFDTGEMSQNPGSAKCKSVGHFQNGLLSLSGTYVSTVNTDEIFTSFTDFNFEMVSDRFQAKPESFVTVGQSPAAGNFLEKLTQESEIVLESAHTASIKIRLRTFVNSEIHPYADFVVEQKLACRKVK